MQSNHVFIMKTIMFTMQYQHLKVLISTRAKYEKRNGKNHRKCVNANLCCTLGLLTVGGSACSIGFPAPSAEMTTL